MPQDRRIVAIRHPLQVAGSSGESRLHHHQPLSQSGQERDRQHIHPDSAEAGRKGLHLARRGIRRRNESRVESQQVHLRMAQERGEEPRETSGEATHSAPAD